MYNPKNQLTWPVKAYGRIIRGDENTPEDQIAEAETEAIALKLAAGWNLVNAKLTKTHRAKRWIIEVLKVPVMLLSLTFFIGIGFSAGVLRGLDLGPMVAGKGVFISIVDLASDDEEPTEDTGKYDAP